MGQIKVKLRSGETVPMTYPDDWSTEQVEQAIHENFPDDSGAGESSIPPVQANEPKEAPEEKIDSKSLMSDLVHSLGKTLRQGTDFAVKTPGMVKSLGKHLGEHPLSALGHDAGQVLAGAGNTAKDVANTGLSIGSWALKHLDPVGSALMERSGKKIEAPQIPEDTGVEKFLGLEPTQKEDRLLHALPELYGAGKLLVKPVTAIAKAFKAPDLKQALRDTQGKVNKATADTGKIFDKVENEVEAKGLSKVAVDQDLIDQAESFLANTPANKELIKLAKTGDYKALRSLQADLRVKGEKALSSAFSAENKMGEEILSTRDQVNKSIQQHLEDTGYEDLAKLLNKARNDYKDIQQTYFSTPALAKVFGKSQKVPKNPKTLLTEESTEMKKFMASHPEVKQVLAKALKHEGKMKKLKKAGSILGIGTTAEVAREVLGGK